MSEKTTAIQSKQKVLKNTLTNVNDAFLPQIEQQLTGHNIAFTEYQRVCVLNALSAINTVLDSKGITWNDAQLDKTNVTQTLLRIAALKLNASAQPREVYFQIRNVKVGGEWKKQIEVGIEGDGNDAILRNFGVDIKKIGQYWLVRENDTFEYPSFNGFETTPPKWTPKGTGKAIRVVYPIMRNDGTCEFWIAERADVKRNLIAHINQNMMNETFGICADRYKATDAQKKQIEAKKQDIKAKMTKLDLEAILSCTELSKWISPSWSDEHSRESMIERKMRNNATKKIPKDFGGTFVEQMYHEATDESVSNAISERSTHANTGDIVDVAFEEIPTVQETSESDYDDENEPVDAELPVPPPQRPTEALESVDGQVTLVTDKPLKTSRSTVKTTSKATTQKRTVIQDNEPY